MSVLADTDFAGKDAKEQQEQLEQSKGQFIRIAQRI